MSDYDQFLPNAALLHRLLVGTSTLVGSIVIALVVWRILFWTLARLATRQEAVWGAVTRRLKRPAAFILPLIAVLSALPILDSTIIPHAYNDPLEHATGILVIVAFAWAIVALIGLWRDISKSRNRIDTADNYHARQLETRVDILSRVAVSLTVVVGLGTILMTFPSIRAIGTTLLASAGLLGIGAGIAARPVFENMIAGLQIAFTQPIRIDDVVIVEKQYGRIEEIQSTYVVVRLWDRRRMVLPLTYFITTPFENWTRHSADLMGSVFVYADYTFPVDELRKALPDLVKGSPLWDGDVVNLQVTDATAQAMQIRALVSARSSSDLSDLQSYVREQMIGWMREHAPDSLVFAKTIRLDAPASAPAALDGTAPEPAPAQHV
jgi:small-conductance mechanosensitive channel